VLLNVQLMFISTHDSAAVSVALVCATMIGVLISFTLGRRVALGSRRLTSALRDLGEGPPRGGVPRGAAQVNTSGQPGEIVALATELTATRERLARAQEQADRLESGRRELVAFLSHDLRTPLAGLRALAEGLEDGVLPDQPAALRQMRLTVDRMTGLVGDLFELSRLSAATPWTPAERTMVSIAELAHDVTGELAAHAASRTVHLVLDLDDGEDRLAVRGNADELARALANLLGNGIRHTRSGGTVRVSASREAGDGIEVHVTDECGGIPAEDLPRVFDVGWRATADRGTQGDAGAGLGLAIAKGVVEAHCGSIAVANVPGGCRFTVQLPGQPVGGERVVHEPVTKPT
jgi:signal transduction histidine kinase